MQIFNTITSFISRRHLSYSLLFPGQGSHYVGMCKNLVSLQPVRDLFEKASEILQFNILQLCLEGPEDRLTETVYCQPAVVLASLAAVEKLKIDFPEAVKKCSSAAGFSVGEYTALMHSEALSFEEGIALVRRRAEVMQHASQVTAGAMSTVVGLEESPLKELCQKAVEASGGSVSIASFLFENGFTVSGDRETVCTLHKMALEAKAHSVKSLKVSGAFHSPLMSGATVELVKHLSSSNLHLPKCTVYSNVTGEKHTSVKKMHILLAKQLTSPVQWNGSIRNILRDFPETILIECGPGQQLKAMLRRIDKHAFKNCLSVCT